MSAKKTYDSNRVISKKNNNLEIPKEDNKDPVTYIKKKFPEAEIYIEGEKISPLYFGEKIIGYTVSFPKYPNTLVVRINLKDFPNIDIKEMKDQIQRIFKKKINEGNPITSLVIDTAQAKEITPKGEIDPKIIVKNLGFLPSEKSEINIAFIHWDKSPGNAPIFTIVNYGQLPKVEVLRIIYKALKKRLAIMVKENNHPGKIFDLFRLEDSERLTGARVVAYGSSVTNLMFTGMPAPEFGGGLVAIHRDASGILDVFFNAGSKLVENHGYPARTTTDINKAFKIIDEWHRKNLLISKKAKSK